MASVRLIVAGLIVAIMPGIASAQRESFVQSAQALARASHAGAVDPSALAESLTRMTVALTAWDRALAAQRDRIDRELTGAAPSRQFQLHIELAVAYSARGRRTDALREFDAAVTLQPASSDAQLLRALTLESAGKADQAARGFHTAWTLDPANATKAYYVVQCSSRLPADDVVRARAVLSKAYESLRAGTVPAPSSPPFVLLDALPDTLSRMPVIGDARTAEGFVLLATGHYTEALASLARHAASADDPLQRFRRAQADEKESRVSSARAGYLAALNGAFAGRSTIYVAIGRLAEVEGDSATAIEAFERAVHLNPNDATMRQELASAYASSGRDDDAFAELVAGLMINPANAALHAAIGHVRLNGGRPAEAIPAFTRALELSPGQYEVRYALATALARAGDADAAAQQLQIFERTRQEMLERRRRDIQQDVDRQDAIRRGAPDTGGTP